MLFKFGVFKLELEPVVGCNYIRSSGAILFPTLREEGRSVVTRDCDTAMENKHVKRALA